MYKMITISTNQNFKEWLNIKMFGRLVDNVKCRSRANHVAMQLQNNYKQKTGENLTIINRT